MESVMRVKVHNVCQTIIPYEPETGGSAGNVVMGLHAPVILLNVTMNFALVFCICKLKLYKRPTYKFILTMSLADMGTGLVMQPLILYFYFYPNCLVTVLVLQPLTYFLIEISCIMVLLVAIDRYLHMKYLLSYDRRMTKTRSHTAILAAIIFSTMFAGISVLASVRRFLFEFHIGIIVFHVPCLSIIALVYLKAFRSLQKRVQDSSIRPGHSQRADLKFAAGTCSVTVVLICCYFPYLIIGSVYLFQGFYRGTRLANSIKKAYIMSISLFLVNSFVNAMILVYNDGKIRRFLTPCLQDRVQQDRRETASQQNQTFD